MLIVQEPVELRSLAVVLGRYTVFLPWLDEPQPFNALSTALAGFSNLPTPRPRYAGKQIAWPAKPLYALDRDTVGGLTTLISAWSVGTCRPWLLEGMASSLEDSTGATSCFWRDELAGAEVRRGDRGPRNASCGRARLRAATQRSSRSSARRPTAARLVATG
jgi:hypothetical protein